MMTAEDRAKIRASLSEPDIRPTCRDDLDSVRRLWADGDVMKYVGFPDGIVKSLQEMGEWLGRIEKKRPYTDHFSIRRDGVFCGETFYSINRDTGLASLDIKLFPFARGKGIAGKALKFAAARAFENGAKKCFVTPHPENAKAIALYRRLGFEQKEMPEELFDPDYPGYLYFELRQYRTIRVRRLARSFFRLFLLRNRRKTGGFSRFRRKYRRKMSRQDACVELCGIALMQ